MTHGGAGACVQNTQLFSPDSAVFVTVTGDGNVLLYNTAIYNQYGAASAAAIIWQSNTGSRPNGPFWLTMQNARALLLLARLCRASLFPVWQALS